MSERRARLAKLLDTRATGVILSPVFTDGEALLGVAREQQLEGVVAKRDSSRYQPGWRSSDWRKIKLRGRQEFVIAGSTRGRGRRGDSIGALILGVHDADGLRFAGNVGTGLTDAELDRLARLLRPLRRETSPFAEVPRLPRVRKGDIAWVEPTSSRRSSLPSGRGTDGCERPSTSGSETTSRPRPSCESARRSPRRFKGGSAC